MFKKIYTILILVLTISITPTVSTAQVQEGFLLGNWQNDDLPEMFFGRYNEVWGIVVDGVEYAVIGSTMGTHFISLDPVDGTLEEVTFVPGTAQGSSIVHRDFHSYQNYLYAVADEGESTLQIMDFSGLPESVEVVYDSNEFIVRSHNIFIDEAHARLYSVDGNVLSLADPVAPTILDIGSFSGAHDVFVRDHILFVNEGNDGMRIFDYTDPDNPLVIGSLTDYNNSGYNHSGWISDDGSHYFLCDETGGSLVKSVAISDLNNIEVVDMFQSDNQNPQHIAHNAMVRDDLLYVSYYSDGVQVFDISDPENVERKAFYDTYPGVDNQGFKGAWGIYCLLPSGRILVSDMATGLYLLAFPEDQGIISNDFELSTCASEELEFEVYLGADFAASGANLSASGMPMGADVSFSENPAMSNSTVEVTVSGLPEGVLFDLTITADDGAVSSATAVQIEVLTVQPFDLELPADQSTDVTLNPVFSWGSVSGLETMIEISSSADFDEADILAEFLTTNTYALPFDLEEFTTYYWRIIQDGACGNFISDIFSFSTGVITGTNEIAAEFVSINPNPVRDEMTIETGDYFQGDLKIELFDVNGRLVNVWNLFIANQQFTLTPSAGLEGLFLLRMSGVEGTLTKKVLLVR